MHRQPTPALGLLALLIALGLPADSTFAAEPAQAHAAEKNEARAAEPPAPGHEGNEQPNILEVQAPLAIWTLIVFLGLMVVLGKFAWKPLMKALHEREAHLEHVLLDSEKARNEAEAIAAENRRQLAQAADQVRALIEEARKEAQASADAILRRAQEEAEASRHRAEREIVNARDQALMEIWSRTADLAVSVAGRVLSKELGPDDHRRLVEVAMSELPANGDGQGVRS